VRTRFEQTWVGAEELMVGAWVRALDTLREKWGTAEALADVLLKERALDQGCSIEMLERVCHQIPVVTQRLPKSWADSSPTVYGKCTRGIPDPGTRLFMQPERKT